MARFLFAVIPAFGHINPTLPIAVELKKRGHQVGYATGLDFQHIIESEGVEFYPVGPPGWNTEISTTGRKMLAHKGMLCNYYFFKHLKEVNDETVGGLRTVVEQYKPDIIVVDCISHAGAQVAELFKIPWATSSIVAGLIPTRDAPPFTTWGLPPSDNTLVKFLYSVIRYGANFVLRFFDRKFNKIRSSLELPPLKHSAAQSTLSPYLILIPTCEGYEYKRSDWPPQAHIIGHSPWGKSVDDKSTFDWIDTLSEEKPLIYACLGTVHVFRSIKFFEIVMDAFKDAPYQIVMSVGKSADLPEFRNAPENCRIEPFVPHAKIFPRTSVVIHHGGLGIIHDCICNGIPQVIVPIAMDSHEWGRRGSVAGISITTPYSKLNPQRLNAATQKVLNDKSFKKNIDALQKVFLEKNAGTTGATLLEKLAQTKAPIYRRG